MRVALIALALAVGTGQSATEALRARDAEIRAALPPEGDATPQARKRIEAIVNRTVDLRAMAEASLGARWKTMSAAQRRRLLAAFESRFRKVSTSEFGTYRSTEIEYRPEIPAEAGLVKVPTKVVVKGEPTEITYSMRRQTAGWRIVDIIIDGVSTVENYRSSFARVISKEGVEGLIRRLERGGAAKRG